MPFTLLSWFPRAMHCDEQLLHMHQTTAFDPNPKSKTDRYQAVQSNDGTIGIPRGVNIPKIPNTPLSKSPS
jgi:hypothetical protein